MDSLERKLLEGGTMLDETTLKNALRKALPRRSPLRPSGEEKKDARQALVLVVTRYASSAGAISGWLESAGYAVMVAATAADARSLAGPFDCAVLDYELGDESGILLAATLSADDRLRTVVFCPDPIAIATSPSEGADEERTVAQLVEIENNVAAALADFAGLQHAA